MNFQLSRESQSHLFVRIGATAMVGYVLFSLPGLIATNQKANSELSRLASLTPTQEPAAEDPTVKRTAESEMSQSIRDFSQFVAKVASNNNLTLEKITGSSSENPVTIGENTSAELSNSDIEFTLTGQTKDLYDALVALNKDDLAFRIRAIQMGRNANINAKNEPSSLTVRAEIYARTSI